MYFFILFIFEIFLFSFYFRFNNFSNSTYFVFQINNLIINKCICINNFFSLSFRGNASTLFIVYLNELI